MERNFVKDLLKNAAQDDQAAEATLEKDVRTLTDLELVLAGGGEDIVVWGPPR